MRAKRNTEVKELETTVNKLQDKNDKLEAQNKEYAKTLQQLQQEMRTLRTQLQGSMGSSHQQQSSSEVHQVCSRMLRALDPCTTSPGVKLVLAEQLFTRRH